MAAASVRTVSGAAARGRPGPLLVIALAGRLAAAVEREERVA